MDKLVLVTGSEGLVGSRFLELSKFKANLNAPKQVELDITNTSELKALLASYDFGAVINFAAYTDVAKAEEERNGKDGLCWQINVEGVRKLAEAVAPYSKKVHFIQISTDMVFPGSKDFKGPYKESQKPQDDLSKLTWYGYTKLQAEKTVSEILGDKATILRLIYPVRAKFDGKLDYLRKPLSLFDEGKLYPVFSDQQISISFIDEISEALDLIIEKESYGIFHASSRDTTTPLELISYLLKTTRGKNDTISNTKVEDFLKSNKLPYYRYPKYGGLKIDETEKTLGINFRTWKEIIDTLITQGLGH